MERVPSYRCQKIAASFRVDGDLDKHPWRLVPRVPLKPADGSDDASLVTSVAAVWTEAVLCVAFWCEDPDIRATMTSRDDKVWQEEAVEIFLQPAPRSETYFEFQLSPANVVRDILVTNPSGTGERCHFNGDWDCDGLTTAIQRRDPAACADAGWDWRAEVSIPFRALGLTRVPETGDAWRVNFFRIDRHPTAQYLSWSPTNATPQPRFHLPARFGTLVFAPASKGGAP